LSGLDAGVERLLQRGRLQGAAADGHQAEAGATGLTRARWTFVFFAAR
jgi:hypothetical protein